MWWKSLFATAQNMDKYDFPYSQHFTHNFSSSTMGIRKKGKVDVEKKVAMKKVAMDTTFPPDMKEAAIGPISEARVEAARNPEPPPSPTEQPIPTHATSSGGF